jgi:hypothetical protein
VHISDISLQSSTSKADHGEMEIPRISNLFYAWFYSYVSGGARLNTESRSLATRDLTSLILNECVTSCLQSFSRFPLLGCSSLYPTYNSEALFSNRDRRGTIGVWGFVDGTMRASCRPGVSRWACYSGHKKFHGCISVYHDS